MHVAAPQRPTATLPDINEHYADLGNGDLNEIYRILNKDDRWVLFLSGGGIGRERYYPEKRSKQLPLPRRNLWSQEPSMILRFRCSAPNQSNCNALRQ